VGAAPDLADSAAAALAGAALAGIGSGGLVAKDKF
jgi:hypothetical protein